MRLPALDPPAPPPAAPDARPRAALREKVLLVVALAVYTFVGYFAVGLATDPAQARSLGTWVDDAIPFVPWTIYLYAWVYTAMLYPAFVVRCRWLFRRVALAYAVVATASVACWVAFPVTSIGIRPDLATIDPGTFHGWGLRVNLALDPPTNLFPSLHLSVATLAALCAAKADRRAGLLAVPIVLGIAVAICTVKQHFVVDGVAGVALGALAYRLVVHPAPTAGRPPEELAHARFGPLSYYAFHASAYAALWVAWALGVPPPG